MYSLRHQVGYTGDHRGYPLLLGDDHAVAPIPCLLDITRSCGDRSVIS